MINKIIDCRAIAEKIIGRARREIKSRGLKLKLGVVLVGDNPTSLSYISQKKKVCEKAGIRFCLYQYPQNIKEEDLFKKIKILVRRSSGLIVQLPLPKRMKTQRILDAVPRKKDVDILSRESLGAFYAGDFSVLPPVVSAVKHILEKEKISLGGKNVLIMGSGRLVGKPLSIWLMANKATLLVANEMTEDVSFLSKRADIIISGVGQANLINGKMIKKGAIIIDAGSSVENGRLRGDINLESVMKRVGRVSTVPGGVGPITTACLIENLVKIQNHKDR